MDSNKSRKQQHTPGIPCPNCKNLIPISIQQIINASVVFCPICGLKLDIDKRKSDKALKLLAKVDEAQKRIEDASRFNK